MARMSQGDRMRFADLVCGYQYALNQAIAWPDLCTLGKEWLDVDYSEDDEMSETKLRKMLQAHVDEIEESFID